MPTVASGQTLNVTSGQTSTGVIVDSGGTLNVRFGGKVSGTVDAVSSMSVAARPLARSS